MVNCPKDAGNDVSLLSVTSLHPKREKHDIKIIHQYASVNHRNAVTPQQCNEPTSRFIISTGTCQTDQTATNSQVCQPSEGLDRVWQRRQLIAVQDPERSQNMRQEDGQRDPDSMHTEALPRNAMGSHRCTRTTKHAYSDATRESGHGDASSTRTSTGCSHSSSHHNARQPESELSGLSCWVVPRS